MFSVLWAAGGSFLLLDTGCRAARRLGIGEPASLRLLAGTVIAVSATWLWLAVLGAIGGLGPRSAAAGIVAAFAALRALEPAPHAVPTARLTALLLGRSRSGRSARIAAWWLAALFVAVALRGLAYPTLSFDSLSYHLPFTAHVLDGGTIPHVDTPFGDPAAAYQPKTEHVLRALLAPIPGHERLVWISALPHLPLLWLAIYVAARALGAHRAAALWGAASAILASVTLSQAADALVDLPVASWWIAFTAIALAWQRPRGRAAPLPAGAVAATAGAALGLSFGAKFLAVALGPLLACVLVPALVHERRARPWAAFAGAAVATGGYFYLRNAWWTGNPAYPVAFELLGRPLLEGPIARDAMFAWVFNLSGMAAAPLPERLAAFASPLVGNATGHDFPGAVRATALACIVPVGLWLGGCARGLTAPGRRTPPALARAGVALLAPATIAFAWFVVPFTYGRFAILAVGAAATAAAFATMSPARLAAAVVAGLALQLARIGEVWQLLAVATLVVAAVAAPVTERIRPRGARARSLAIAALAVVLVTAAGTRPSIVDHTPASWRPGLSAIEALPRDARIAYAGNNVPYVFRGSVGRFVEHVPIDGERTMRFDERAARWKGAGRAPAISASPGLDRGVQDAAAWLAALRDGRFDRLVVTTLDGTQLVQVRHDGAGFPIEDAWARAAAPMLRPVHSDDVMRVYAVERGDAPDDSPLPPMPARVERVEPDAFALLPHPSALARRYPKAVAEIAEPQYARTRERARALVEAGVDPRTGAKRAPRTDERTR